MMKLYLFLKEIYNYRPKLLLLVIGSMLLVALLDSIGILSIFPLLSIIGISGAISSPFLVKLQFLKLTNSININILIIVSFYLLIVLTTAIISYIQNKLTNTLRYGYTAHIANRLFTSVIYAPWIYLLNLDKSKLTSCFSNEIQRLSSCTNLILDLVTNFIILIAYLFLALWISPKMTFVIIVFGSTTFIILFLYSKQVKQCGTQLSNFFHKMISLINENLGLLKEAKVYGLEAKLADEFTQIQKNISDNGLEYSKVERTYNFYHKILAGCFIAILTIIALIILKLNIFQVVSLSIVFAKTWPRLGQVNKLVQYIGYTFAGYEQISKLEDDAIQATISASKDYERSMSDNTVNIKSDIGLIRCTNISFSYQSNSNVLRSDVLNNISFEIEKGSIVACVGVSGSGKSTLSDIILGLLFPSTGSLFIDKTLLNDMLPKWQKSIAVVSQDFFLSTKTIRENLSWCNTDIISDEEIWRVLDILDLKAVINKLPKRLDEQIGERGIKLSGGERQRLVIARALLRKPQILILDEATSALDNLNEQRLISMLRQLKITIFIIAHRLSTVINADNILVLENGCLVEQGKYNDLMAKMGKFYNLNYNSKY